MVFGSMEECRLCPRGCGANRAEGQTGFCGVGSNLVCARAALHMWEEPCISGKEGSGTVFFSGCNLRCVFCQNYNISRAGTGKEISIERLSQIFLELQEKKANNINLVTGTHYIPQIVEALKLAMQDGLSIPVVYNTSSYESVEALRLIAPYVDVWLPDLKYKSDECGMRYSKAPDYFEVASKALAFMVSDISEKKKGMACEFNEKGIIQCGVIVRHLVLPGNVADSKRVLRYLHETYHDQIYISIMNQFTPSTDLTNYPEINRRLTEEEYQRVIDFAEKIGIEKGFIQEGETCKESFIPEFDLTGV